MIQTMFETEGLLGVEPVNSGGATFSDFCDQVVNSCQVETFYVFTVGTLVQSNDQKSFYRDRIFNLSLRVFYLLIEIRTLNEGTPSKKTKQSLTDL